MNKFIKLKPYFRASARSYHLLKSLILRRKTSQILAKGITLVELFLTMLVAGIIIQLAYLGFSWNRQLYLNDQARNEASQNLATAFSIIGSDIKQAGAGLDASFPAVLIRPYPTNPTGTPNLNSPDFNSEITLRRLISGTQPRTCKNNATPAATTISGSPTEIFVLNSAPPLVAGCNNDTAGIAVVTALKTYRLQNGGTVRIFIYPSTTGTGEFLNYTGENFDTNYTSLIVNGTLTGTYNIDSAKIMLIEERKYRLGCSDSSIADASCPTNKLQNLQLIVNDGNPVNLVNNLGTFAVTATIQQDVTNTTTAQFICWLINQTGNPSCNSSVTGYVWSDLYSINVTLRPQFDSDSGSILSTGTQDTINSLQQTQNFLPRNVLNY